jgi:hypothetical protein
MDEAEVFGDRVVIAGKGRVHGSPDFLKKKSVFYKCFAFHSISFAPISSETRGKDLLKCFVSYLMIPINRTFSTCLKAVCILVSVMN